MREECLNIVYVYEIVREDLATGEQGKRKKKLYRYEPDLEVGGLYLHLGPGCPGAQRVLSMKEEYF